MPDYQEKEIYDAFENCVHSEFSDSDISFNPDLITNTPEAKYQMDIEDKTCVNDAVAFMIKRNKSSWFCATCGKTFVSSVKLAKHKACHQNFKK